MARGDLAPPRPQGAPVVPEVTDAVVMESPDTPHVAGLPESVPALAAFEAPNVSPVVGATAVESESLAAELEALLAADEPVAEEHPVTPSPLHAHEELGHADDFAALMDTPIEVEDDFGSGLKFSAEDELPALHDGHFGAHTDEIASADHGVGSGLKFGSDAELPPLHDGRFGLDTLDTQGHAPLDESLVESALRPMPSFQLDHLALEPLDDSFISTTVGKEASSSLLGLASSWSLVDEDDAHEHAPAPTPEINRSTEFGIEKLSAADFLAPEGGAEKDSIIEPGMKLELVSMEEALAPREFDSDGTEMMLTELDGAIGRLLVLGAAADSLEAVCSFLSMLPPNLRAAVLHVQHLGGKTAETLSETLTRYCELPVRVAAPGVRARVGEVLVVPAGQQARIHRDGRVDLQPLENNDVRSSPIDASFTMAANVFGRNAQAIVFAGQANDALGGCQAIHDRGGQVWIESSDGQYADMVHGIEAERLHSYSGTPAELAARLLEEMSMEGRR